jgi:hypothetical protein
VKRKGLGTDSGWPTTTWAAPPAEPASRLSIRSAWLDRAGGGGGGAKAAIEGAVGEEAEAIAQEIEGGAVEGVGGKETGLEEETALPARAGAPDGVRPARMPVSRLSECPPVAV